MHNFAAFDGWTFDKKSGRYRHTSGAKRGQFASRTEAMELVRQNIQVQQASLVELADKLANQSINLRQFQVEAGELLRRIHVQSAILGKDGIDRMTSADWLAVGRNLKQQYYAGKDPATGKRFGLKYLAIDIRDGKVSLPQLRSRLSLFGQSGMQSYWQARVAAEMAGDRPYGIRILADVIHCESCVRYAALPPQPLQDVILPGQQCECRANCKCTIMTLTLEEAVQRGMSA